MRSIRSKILILVISAILITVILLGGLGFGTVKSIGDKSSMMEMNLICDNGKTAIDSYLNSVEQTVEMFASYATTELQPIRVDSNNETEIYNHLNESRVIFHSVAKHTKGVLTYYYRFDPVYKLANTGFWYTRWDDTHFKSTPLTVIDEFDPDDTSHVGWFYQPMLAGEAIWMDPYFNSNLGKEMISYVAPVYQNKTFVAVAGIDIDYQTLADLVKDIKVYETGYAFLTDDEFKIVYHPTEEQQKEFEQVLAFAREIEENDDLTGDERPLVEYNYLGTEKMASVSTLSNGMKLFVVAPKDEIQSDWRILTGRVMMYGSIIALLFTAIAIVQSKRITGPLKKLTEAAQQVEAGNYDVEFTYDEDDEVGILTSSFKKLTNHLKLYISDLNSKVYKDSLTSVKNKGGFDIFAQKLNDQIRNSETDDVIEFAIIMFDCNNLKKINDNYGHEKGDIYLKTASRLISTTFAHSPVFRMGGDEFATVLQRDDFKNREALLETFDKNADEINKNAEDPWDGVSLAKGMVVYDPMRDDCVEDTLKLADDLMYRNKSIMKGEAV